MDRFYKIQKYIPNFDARFEKNKLIIEFQKDIYSLAKSRGLLTTATGPVKKLEILLEKDTIDNPIMRTKLVDENNISSSVCDLILKNEIMSYNQIDSLRDCLLFLSGAMIDSVHHDNLLDNEYLKNAQLFFDTLRIPPFEIQFNHLENRVKKPIKPKYIKSSFIFNSRSSRENNKNTEPPRDKQEPYMYINFSGPVKVYTNFLSGMDYISAKHFGVHVEQRELLNEFAIYSYNDYLERGLCIFKRSTISGSFIDAYDIFDALYVFLSCVQGNDGYVYKYETKKEEYNLYHNDIPIEL